MDLYFQLMAIATTDGSIHVHLSMLPIVAAVCGTSVGVLSNINVVSVHTFSDDRTSSVVHIETPVEPEILGLSFSHLVIALHNRAWYYDMVTEEPQIIREREYLTNIKSIRLCGQYVSVLYSSGSLQLHVVESDDAAGDRENRLFPDG